MKFISLLILVTLSGSVFAQDDFLNLRDAELKAELQKRSSEQQVSLSYKQARIKLFNEVYLEQDERGYYNRCVYCLTNYYRTLSNDPSEIPDHNIINTEHTWPQSRFNHNLNTEVQKSDLHHLYPTFSKINSQRGNFPFANVGASTSRALFCDQSKLGNPMGYGKGVYFEPPVEHKGNVARAIFYFSTRYDVAIDPIEEIFLKFWHMLDPVDELEKRRHEIIFGIQKNRNPYIDYPELVLQVADF